MKTIFVTLIVIYFALGPNSAFGLLPILGISSAYSSTQVSDAQKKADEIVASLNKKKEKVVVIGTRPAIFDDFFKTYCPVFR